MGVHEKNLEAQENLDKAMQKLANTPVQEEFAYEYLYLVVDLMEMYERYVDSVENDNYEYAIEVANQIINKIEKESESGILKT